MSKAYSINYDLKAAGRNYTGLYEEIKKFPQWWHYLESTWVIITDENPNQIWKRLGKHVDKNDYFLIIELRDNVQDWLPEEAWKWIHEKVPS